MKPNTNNMWESWGRTNALYTEWCSERSINPYQHFVLYAINGHEPTTQKKIADYTGLSKQTVGTVMRSLTRFLKKRWRICTMNSNKSKGFFSFVLPSVLAGGVVQYLPYFLAPMLFLAFVRITTSYFYKRVAER